MAFKKSEYASSRIFANSSLRLFFSDKTCPKTAPISPAISENIAAMVIVIGSLANAWFRCAKGVTWNHLLY